jgi:hypothetical protein
MSNFITLLDGQDNNVYCHSFVIDSIDNIYTTGYTTAKIIKVGYKKYSRNSKNEAGYVLKINKYGEVEWFHWIDGTDILASYSIAVDSLNNVVLTGYAKSQIIINDKSYSKLDNTNNTFEGFVIKMEQNGNVKWVKWIEGARSDIGYKLSIDKSDNIIVVGASNSSSINNITRPTYPQTTTAQTTTTTTQTTTSTNTQTTTSNKDYKLQLNNDLSNLLDINTAGFVIKMAPDGAVLWFKWIDGSKYDQANAVILDSYDNIYVTGTSISRLLIIDNKSYTKLNNNESIYVAKFNPDGTSVWCIWIAGEGVDSVSNIKCDSFNYLYVAGVSTSKNITFNETLYERLNDDKIYTPFVIKFNSDESHESIWFKWFENDKDAHIYGLATDKINNVYIGGAAGAPYIYVNDEEFVNEEGNTHAFLFKLDSNGEVVWNTWINNYRPDNKTTFIYNLYVDKNYNIYINGSSDGNELYFNNEYLCSNDDQFENSFVIKYNLNDITRERNERTIILDMGYSDIYRTLLFFILFVLYIYAIWVLYKRGLI